MLARVRRVMASRPCGGCTACCTALAVDALQKPAGEKCVYDQRGVGCAIYENRPDQCRGFECLWRTGVGGEADRPDRVGLVLHPQAEADRPMMIVREARPGAIDDPAARDLVDRVSRGRAVLLARFGEIPATILIGAERLRSAAGRAC